MYKGEWFNTISHFIGAVAGLVGLILLVIVAVKSGDPWKIISFSVYGATLLFLYAASTLYHSTRGKVKQVFQIMDYHGIYLLIAGTYTPFALVTLRGVWGWTIFAIIWCLAILGILIDTFQRHGHRFVQLAIYVIMGWLIIVALKPLMQGLTLGGFLLLLTGGIFYTVGVIFFVLDHRVSYFHGIWHIFVLLGSLMHYLTVMFYVL